MAYKRTGGYTSFYSAAGNLPGQVLRRIAAQAGVHIYNGKSDPVYVNSLLPGVYSDTDGEICLQLKEEAELEDLFEGKAYKTQGKSLRFPARKGMAKLFMKRNREYRKERNGMPKEFIMHRHESNPIISPEDFPIPADSVMNCGQAMYQGKTVLLVAAIYHGFQNGRNTGIHVAMSDDGVHFEIEKEPLCKHVDWAGDVDFDCWVIDPRLTQIGDTYYIVRPGQGEGGPAALLEKTKDFKTLEFVDCIALPPNRVPCLFPEKINGMYAKLDRPGYAGSKQGSIWISFSPDLVHWGHYRPLLFPYGTFFSAKVGPTPPIKTKDGWLTIIHGVWNTCSDSRYSLSAILLDLEDPTKVIGKMQSWILTPEAEYERVGHVSNVVFACGCIPDYEKDEIRIYYGAADERVCLATGCLSELVEACKKGL